MFITDGLDFNPWLAPDGVPGAAAASPAVIPGEESDEAPEADETEIIEEAEGVEQDVTPPGVGPKGPPVGSPRWNKVYAGFKTAQRYSQFGSPEQVEQQLKRLQRYDEQIEAAEKKDTDDTPETKELREARDRVEAQLRKMFPWMEGAPSVVKDNELRRESLRWRAGESTVAYMEAEGIETSQENYDRLTGVLQEIVANDRRLYIIYQTDPERAVKDAIALYEQPFKSQASRKAKADLIRGKKPHEALPKPAPKSAGGPSAPAPPAEPKDMREAEKMFIERLRQANRG